jgi:hypothetical protein
VNAKRLVLGGLAAGAFLAATDAFLWGVLFREQSEAAMAAAGLTYASWAIPAFVVVAFVIGLALAWLYAAIRPRYGAGLGTALRAGGLVWLLCGLIPSIWMASMGLVVGSAMLNVVIGLLILVQILAAAAIAGWLYQEEAAPATAPGHAH